MIEINHYAPVIIPTLNRYEHFKRCLESLEQCTGAAKTDVYVGLDYPPSEKYVDGWKQIDSYLKEKERKHSFNHLFIRRRKTNCGVGNPNSNMILLIKEVEATESVYISSEDDNEFSPNFLEYMNKCLIRFSNDERIIKVCGYNFEMSFPEMYRNNFYLSKSGCGWGTGSWTGKNLAMSRYFDLLFLRTIIRNRQTYHLLKKRSRSCIDHIIKMLKSGQLHGDAVWDIYCVLEDKYVVLPRKSKTRNYGNDGTGWHSPRMNESQHKFYANQQIDTDRTFEFSEDIFTYEPVYLERKNYCQKTTMRSIMKRLVLYIDVFLLRTINYLPKSKFI